MSEALSSSRPSKRPRPDPSRVPSFKRDDEFWFKDGNMVLVTRNVGFRVYRGILAAHSTVFSDMLEVGNGQGEMYHGSPLVEVADSPEDLRHFLAALFPEVKFFPQPEDIAKLSFHQVSAVIRLAHKYQVEDLLRQALLALRRYYTDDFRIFQKTERAQYFTDAPDQGQCIAAVNLARLTDTPSILPVALYQCYLLGSAVLYGFKHEDGSVEYLDKGDEDRCMKGGTFTMLAWQFISYTALEKVLAQECRDREHLLECSGILCANLRETMGMHRPDVFSSHWKDLATNASGVCESCASCMDDILKSGSKAIWCELPEYFSVDVPGWNSGTSPDSHQRLPLQ